MTNINNILEQLFEIEDLSSRCELVQKLGRFRTKESINALTKVLAEENDNKIKSYATSSLIKIGGKTTAKKVIKLLRNDSWVTRMKAAEILGELDYQIAVGPLIRTLRDESEEAVREWLIIALGELGNKRAVRILTNCLKNDPQEDIRMEAARALGKIKSEKTTDDLIDSFYSEKNYKVRWAAAAALAKIRDPAANQILLALSKQLVDIIKKEKNQIKVSAAARTLGEIGQVEHAKTLVKALTTTQEMVRLEASVALDRMAKRFNYNNKEEFIEELN
jgi:HEAT repeat protein